MTILRPPIAKMCRLVQQGRPQKKISPLYLSQGWQFFSIRGTLCSQAGGKSMPWRASFPSSVLFCLLTFFPLPSGRNWTVNFPFLLHLCIMCVCLVIQSCVILCDPIDCHLQASSSHGIFHTRVLAVGCYFMLAGTVKFFTVVQVWGHEITFGPNHISQR